MNNMHRSNHNLTPKLLAALSLLEPMLLRREQAVFFAPFLDPLDAVARCLTEAGVPFASMDGRKSPKERAELSEAFKQRRHAIQLCGTDSCAEGYSWPGANNIILLAYSWALDRMAQCVDRCHRLNSRLDLNLYILVCEGTVDDLMAANLSDKRDTAQLVLDGQLQNDHAHELSMAELLSTAQSEFNAAYSGVAANDDASCDSATRLYADTKTIDESVLEEEWPALRERLRAAAKAWQLGTAEEKMGKGEKDNTTSASAPLPLFPSSPLLSQHPWLARLQRRRQNHGATIKCSTIFSM